MTDPGPNATAERAGACPEQDEAGWAVGLAEDRAVLERAEFDAALERACLHRISEAWHTINQQHLKRRLRPPSFRLLDGERRWGSWDPTLRVLSISRRQVLCYTWGSVLETLRHEMAHQFVSEILLGDGEPPHGRAFQDACRLLGADPAARGDGGTPLGRPVGPHEDPGDARLRLIHKLLALADKNPDEHEARAAFARAGQLMLRYNLDARVRPSSYTFRQLGQPSGRVPHHCYLIAGILQDFFFVECLWVESYEPLTARRGSVLEVMGTPSNVGMADYVYACLERQSLALWEEFKRQRQLKDRRAKREYLDGLLAGFRSQLERGRRRSAERGLIWVGDPGLRRYCRSRYPRTVRSQLGGVGTSEVRQRGVEAGERLRLSPPLGGGAAARGHRLPG